MLMFKYSNDLMTILRIVCPWCTIKVIRLCGYALIGMFAYPYIERKGGYFGSGVCGGV